MAGGEPEQAKEDLRRQEGVATCRVAVVRNHIEHLAQRVEGEMANRRASGEGTVSFEVQREIHRVEASIHRAKPPAALVAGVERSDVVTDVMSDDHAIAQVVEESRELASSSSPPRASSRVMPCTVTALVFLATVSSASKESSSTIS